MGTEESNDFLGYLKATTVNNCSYQLLYEPPELKLALKKQKGEILSESSILKIMEEGKEYLNFKLNTKRLNFTKLNEEEKKTHLEHINSMVLKSDGLVDLIHKSDTIPCVFSHVEPYFSNQGELTILIAFDNPMKHDSLMDDFQIVFLDKFYSNQTIQFDFFATDLNTKPKFEL